MVSVTGVELVRWGFIGDEGSIELGDSGEELGEGSVREDSMVEMVVVGDDSTDSKDDAESRRITGEKK